MSTGRVLYHWHGGQMTLRSQGIMQVYGEAHVEINPDDAAKLGIQGKKTVRVTSRRGSIEAQAAVQVEGEAQRVLRMLANWEAGHEQLFKSMHYQSFERYAGMPWGDDRKEERVSQSG